MKKTLITLLALVGMMSASAQQTWDFTHTPDADSTALAAAKSEWTATTSGTINRFESINAIEGAITAGGQELTMTKGLTISGAAAKKIRIDVNNRLQLAGKNITVSTPALQKGQVVTIEFASTGDNAVTFDQQTNLSGTSGFTTADKNTVQKGTGTVTADGSVSFKSTGGSINIFSISVSGGSTPAVEDFNKAVITLRNNTVKQYNTANVSSIDLADNGKVTVTANGTAESFDDVASINFVKKQATTPDTPDSGDDPTPGDDSTPTPDPDSDPEPAVIINGDLTITDAKGWLESAYVKWNLLEGAKSYAVYVKGGQYADFTKIDQQLVRNYGTYGRADVVGLKAGTYELKVIPVNSNNQEEVSKSSSVSNLEVRNYNRTGYAHHKTTEGIGAYNNDGTLKQGARVLYITKNNAKTVTLSMSVGKNEETRTGIQDIIQAYEKGTETRPLAIRIIGKLAKSDMPELGSSGIGLQVKGKGQNMNLTIEGIGNDATLHGYGVLVRACKFVELRNFAVMMHPEDGISFDTDNEHVWGHHLDIFYGENKGGDKTKGDGSFDVKGTFYCTVSDNHFWDSGKCNLNSNGDEVDYVTYHHNWYDHSDSRHPRVRNSKHLHVLNNYFDGNSKYGVGATTGSCIFVEKNYFRKCKYPMLISKQGSDIHNGVGSSSDTKGTFSGEDGGMIKAYDNYITGQNSFEPYVAGDALYSQHFDAYVVTNRNDQVPANVVTLKGGTNYNNFDTANDFYTYTPDVTANVPGIVMGHYGAGRCEHGDFQWTFNNTTEDSNYDVISGLSNALKNYQTTLVGLFGDESAQNGEQGGEQPGGSDEPGTDQPGTDDTPSTPITDATIYSFDGSPSDAKFNVGSSSFGDGKITYNGTYYKKGVKLNSSGSIKFTSPSDCKMTIILATSKPATDVTLNGTKTTVGGTKNEGGSYYQMDVIQLTAGTEYTITKGSAESLVMLIILAP